MNTWLIKQRERHHKKESNGTVAQGMWSLPLNAVSSTECNYESLRESIEYLFKDMKTLMVKVRLEKVTRNTTEFSSDIGRPLFKSSQNPGMYTRCRQKELK